MAEIKIRFDLTFSRRFMTAAFAFAVMLCAVPELDSESVTLSTYYPAPSGVYTNMITTSNTYLARDGGNVGIGTIAPGAKLDVNGAANINGALTVAGAATFSNNVTGAYGMTPGYVSWATYGTGAGGAAIYNDAGAYQGLMLVGNASGPGGLRRVKVWDELTVNGGSFTSGATTSTQGCGAPQTLIYSTPGGGTTALCGGGQYVTTITGFYTRYNLLPLDRGPNLTPPINPTANYICCACPPTGCVL